MNNDVRTVAVENMSPCSLKSLNNVLSSIEPDSSVNKLDDIVKRLTPTTIPLISKIKIEEIDSGDENLVPRAASVSSQTSSNFMKVSSSRHHTLST